MTDDMPSLGYELLWNEQAHGWELVSTGAVIADATIHTEIRAHAIYSSTAFDGITANMFTGDMAIGSWQAAMIDEIKSGHTANAIFGAGGVGNMTPEAWARLEDTIAKEAQYLGEFAQGVSDGTVSPLQARARAKQYSQAMEQSYWNEWKAGIDNPDWTLLPLLGQSPGDGSTQCHGNCTCTLSFSSDGVSWDLGITEDHCEDCPSLAAGGPYRVV